VLAESHNARLGFFDPHKFFPLILRKTAKTGKKRLKMPLFRC
jgi:hypothetical protein